MTHAPNGGSLIPTGSGVIDAEHGAILDLLSAMTGGGPVGLAELTALRHEVAGHFATETAEMAILAVERRERHEQAHRNYLANIDALIATAERGGSLSDDDANRLMLWFIVHSNTADTELVEAARRAGDEPPMIAMDDWLDSLDEADRDALRS
ncbi:hemerythrin [Azospirillum sp. OGB3]|uniref:hemerythrin family protein n=1 Tax=Azospirillum sp. OGB3 TaxID=2587012 RepID=UPI0016057B18|nr:hemerythrin family protein [Azospirillum sp. OGB3]MBB3263582.1 hemerythrin [Azospirillum sp. OGB3]